MQATFRKSRRPGQPRKPSGNAMNIRLQERTLLFQSNAVQHRDSAPVSPRRDTSNTNRCVAQSWQASKHTLALCPVFFCRKTVKGALLNMLYTSTPRCFERDYLWRGTGASQCLPDLKIMQMAHGFLIPRTPRLVVTWSVQISERRRNDNMNMKFGLQGRQRTIQTVVHDSSFREATCSGK